LTKPSDVEKGQWFLQRCIAHLPTAGEMMFNVTCEDQRAPFSARETDPLKVWKLSPIDKASLDRWDDDTESKEAMFFYTDTADASWAIVKSNDKKRAQLNCMRHFLQTLEYPNKDARAIGTLDPLIVGHAAQILGDDASIYDAAELRRTRSRRSFARHAAAPWHGRKRALGCGHDPVVVFHRASDGRAKSGAGPSACLDRRKGRGDPGRREPGDRGPDQLGLRHPVFAVCRQ